MTSAGASIIGPRLQTALEAQALREGILDRADYAYGNLYDLPPTYGTRGTDRRVLMHLCLFPAIETTRSDFMLQRLASRSGLHIRQVEPRSIRRYVMCDLDGALGKSEFDELIETCHEEIIRICLAQKAEIIQLVETWIAPDSNIDLAHLKSAEGHAIRRLCRQSFIPTIEILTGWYGGDMSATPFQGLGFELALADGTRLPNWLLDDPYFEIWLDKVDDFYVRLLATLFYSHLNSPSAAVGKWWQKKKKPEKRDAQLELDVAHLCTIQFRSELRIVPDPRNIAEAIEFGNSREMDRLREKIWEWINFAGSDRPSLETRIRHDIEMASQELRRLKRFKEFAESPLVFGTKMVLGQIPFVSSAITAADAAGWAYERWITRKNLWVAIK